jgi:hypothetical protein
MFLQTLQLSQCGGLHLPWWWQLLCSPSKSLFISTAISWKLIRALQRTCFNPNFIVRVSSLWLAEAVLANLVLWRLCFSIFLGIVNWAVMVFVCVYVCVCVCLCICVCAYTFFFLSVHLLCWVSRVICAFCACVIRLAFVKAAHPCVILYLCLQLRYWLSVIG